MSASLEQTDGVSADAPTVLRRPASERTRWGRRLAAVAAYAVVVWLWFRLAHALALPENPLTVSVLVWLATTAWSAEAVPAGVPAGLVAADGRTDRLLVHPRLHR